MATTRLGLGLGRSAPSTRTFLRPSASPASFRLPCNRSNPLSGLSGRKGSQKAFMGLSRGYGTSSARPRSSLALAAGTGTAAITVTSLAFASHQQPLQCEASSSSSEYRPYAAKRNADEEVPPAEVDSIVSISHLSFGTVTGFCAGVFVKKGLMVIAFLLGGGFVLLQYLHSRALITINWPGFARSYESVLARQTAEQRGDSRLAKVVNGLFDFLTADFQGRATFAAGFVLGARMG